MPPPLPKNNTVALCCNVCIIHVMHTAHTTTQQHATACANTIVCASAILLTTRDYTMQAYCADYSKGLSDAEVEELFEDYDALVQRFEREFADLLRGCDSDNVGGVVLYLRGGEEVAFFDYENAHGAYTSLGTSVPAKCIGSGNSV